MIRYSSPYETTTTSSSEAEPPAGRWQQHNTLWVWGYGAWKGAVRSFCRCSPLVGYQSSGGRQGVSYVADRILWTSARNPWVTLVIPWPVCSIPYVCVGDLFYSIFGISSYSSMWVVCFLVDRQDFSSVVNSRVLTPNSCFPCSNLTTHLLVWRDWNRQRERERLLTLLIHLLNSVLALTRGAYALHSQGSRKWECKSISSLSFVILPSEQPTLSSLSSLFWVMGDHPNG